MANELDELSTDNLRPEGLDANVIAKKLPATVGIGSKIFDIAMMSAWFIPGILTLILAEKTVWKILPLVLGIIPVAIWIVAKINAKNYFQQLQQKIQHNASQIDNYLEQRVVVLQNCAALVTKAVNLDKETFTEIARVRAGMRPDDDDGRNETATVLDATAKKIQVAFENYPDLQAHNEIHEAMKQNMYLQREITAARELYNDSINAWNRDLFVWPVKQIVAAKAGYTTRIPFIASQEIKQQAKSVFF